MKIHAETKIPAGKSRRSHSVSLLQFVPQCECTNQNERLKLVKQKIMKSANFKNVHVPTQFCFSKPSSGQCINERVNSFHSVISNSSHSTKITYVGVISRLKKIFCSSLFALLLMSQVVNCKIQWKQKRAFVRLLYGFQRLRFLFNLGFLYF